MPGCGNFLQDFPMIEVRNLVKHFGSKAAVDGISFSVARGEVLGFLGPNGAGKSTTMRMLTGFLWPDGGSASIGGIDVGTDPIGAKRLLGYLPESAPSYGDMSVSAFLRFCGAVRGMGGAGLRAAVEEAVERCFLQPVREQSIETLSKGYRHRVGLAQAILHDPPALVLDEPTDGLDPNQKHEVRQLIRKMGESKAIVFSTHILEEVEAACTRAIIIDRGRVVANGTPAELKARGGGARVLVRLQGGESEACAKALKELEGVAGAEVADGVVRVRAVEGVAAEELAVRVGAALRPSWQLAELRSEERRLDEVFREITTGDAGRRAG
jgi:ABC-2 type transport system ATP-binding protein